MLDFSGDSDFGKSLAFIFVFYVINDFRLLLNQVIGANLWMAAEATASKCKEGRRYKDTEFKQNILTELC